MRLFNKIFCIFLILTLPAVYLAAQQSAFTRIQAGIDLYSQGRWHEAVLELRRGQAEAASAELRGEALYWISLSLISMGEYEEALRNMNTMELAAPGTFRTQEMTYHKGRVQYLLGHYNEAIITLGSYASSLEPGPSGYLSGEDSSRRAAAFYWIGESLLAMGQLDLAQEIFYQITVEYPLSSKYEASVYRLAIIEHRRVEAELLALLRWSHEESLRNIEEFQRRETFYDQALSSYQRRLDALEGSSDPGYSRVMELEDENLFLREQLFMAEERLRLLEILLTNASQNDRLYNLRISAEELERAIQGDNQ